MYPLSDVEVRIQGLFWERIQNIHHLYIRHVTKDTLYAKSNDAQSASPLHQTCLHFVHHSTWCTTCLLCKKDLVSSPLHQTEDTYASSTEMTGKDKASYSVSSPR